MKAIPFVLVLAACGPAVSYAPFRAAPNRVVPAAAVEVFFAPPRCPFQELGMVEAHAGYAQLEDAVLAMRAAAGQRGADAILIADRRFHTVHRGGTIYTAIAVARSEACPNGGR